MSILSKLWQNVAYAVCSPLWLVLKIKKALGRPGGV
jgi:hypothetical protein